MLTFGSVALGEPSAIKFSSTYTPDKRTLSLLFDNALCNDQSDSEGRYTTTTFDVICELQGDGSETVQIDTRGALTAAGPSAFGLARLQIDGTVHIRLAEETSPNFYDRIKLTKRSPGKFAMSILLLANGGKERGEALVAVDSIDMTFVS